jgi:glycosyltransferase involved in cell wall biosynthesis
MSKVYTEVFIASHTDGRVGSLDTLLDYLKQKGRLVTTLSHPLDDYSTLPTVLTTREDIQQIARKPRGIFNLLEDFFMSIKYLRATECGVFLGVSNFDTLPAVFCRIFLRKKIPKIIYYPCDYSEDRFANPIMNLAYKLVERMVVRGADLTISNTHRSEQQRILNGLKRGRSIILPNPVNIPDPYFTPKRINKHKFVYVGDISNEHGLYDIIECLSPVIERLVIIGTGRDKERTIKLAKSKGFHLEMHGYKPHAFAMQYLRQFDGIGLAPYNLSAKWTYYASPLKVSEYIASGLPVLISKVPEVAETIASEGLGVVYDAVDFSAINDALAKFNPEKFHLKAEKFYHEQNYLTAFEKLPL